MSYFVIYHIKIDLVFDTFCSNVISSYLLMGWCCYKTDEKVCQFWQKILKKQNIDNFLFLFYFVKIDLVFDRFCSNVISPKGRWIFLKPCLFRKYFNLLFNGQKPFSSDDRHGLETCSQLNFYCHALWYLSKSNMGGYILGVASLLKKISEFDLNLYN